ncbi:hypothetical protein FB008_1455 [Sinorhizobium medicae]|nr:hypothetical protein FB008_1455 [Sinorhizobium medicae]
MRRVGMPVSDDAILRQLKRDAAHLTAMGETLRTTETLRVPPIASPAQTRITNHRTPAAKDECRGSQQTC